MQNGSPIGDLDQDQTGHGFEQAHLLQHPDRRNDGWWHDQASQHQDTDDRAEPPRPALPDVGDHGAEDDENGNTNHREDDAVDERDDHEVVAGLDHLLEVVQQREGFRPGELQQVRLRHGLGGDEKDEGERHEEEDCRHRDGNQSDDDAARVFHDELSPRLSHQVSGTTMTVTSRNSTTLPAVDRP